MFCSALEFLIEGGKYFHQSVKMSELLKERAQII